MYRRNGTVAHLRLRSLFRFPNNTIINLSVIEKIMSKKAQIPVPIRDLASSQGLVNTRSNSPQNSVQILGNVMCPWKRSQRHSTEKMRTLMFFFVFNLITLCTLAGAASLFQTFCFERSWVYNASNFLDQYRRIKTEIFRLIHY